MHQRSQKYNVVGLYSPVVFPVFNRLHRSTPMPRSDNILQAHLIALKIIRNISAVAGRWQLYAVQPSARFYAGVKLPHRSIGSASSGRGNE